MDHETTTPVPPGRLMLPALGFTLWAVAFVVLYATNAIGCAFGWPQPLQRIILIGLTLVFVAAAAGLLVLARRHHEGKGGSENPPGPDLAQMGVYASAAALLATLLILMPSIAISMCI